MRPKKVFVIAGKEFATYAGAQDHWRRHKDEVEKDALVEALDRAGINWEGYTGTTEEVVEGMLRVFDVKIKKAR